MLKGVKVIYTPIANKNNNSKAPNGATQANFLWPFLHKEKQMKEKIKAGEAKTGPAAQYKFPPKLIKIAINNPKINNKIDGM